MKSGFDVGEAVAIGEAVVVGEDRGATFSKAGLGNGFSSEVIMHPEIKKIINTAKPVEVKGSFLIGSMIPYCTLYSNPTERLKGKPETA
ncbi:MAG: hypothetical protein A2Z14_07995 [Chloroflexi bacterium RBG_16_48_8]|nr:MAG: hypothetical protein A2Z14_07995 [Chloroflexi bacterium RBG_16_48_8]